MRKLICIIIVVIFSNQAFSIERLAISTEDPLMQLAYHFNLPHTDICIINIDGSGDYCLTNTDDVVERDPVWSPDGRFLAYHATDEPVGLGSSTTYIYDFEHGETRELPGGWYVDEWSPDGAFLLTTKFDEGDTDIYVLRPDGSDLQVLTDDQIADFSPTWSPDGTQIAYITGLPEGTLMIMDADGDNPHALTSDLHVSIEVSPAWSPDSSQIAFAVNSDYITGDQPSEIYVINADGTDLHQLTDTGRVNLDPRWSPDGSQIVFYGYEVGAFDDPGDTTSLRTDVFIMNADGSGLTNLTQRGSLDYHPAWSPDGEWIAFASTWEAPGIFIMRPDGTDMRMVTNEPPFAEGGREANNPVWRPLVR
jgi:TolB protein